MFCVAYFQMILNNSNTIDKGDEYEFFKLGLDSGMGEFKYSLLTAPSKFIYPVIYWLPLPIVCQICIFFIIDLFIIIYCQARPVSTMSPLNT